MTMMTADVKIEVKMTSNGGNVKYRCDGKDGGSSEAREAIRKRSKK